MKPITLLASIALAAILTLPVQAQVVIVSVKNPISKLTKEQVSQIFLGQAKTFITGGTAEPLDLPEGAEIRNAFYQKTLNKPSAQMKAFWAKMEFSGNSRAPKALSAEEVVKLVASNPKFIGYVDASFVTPEVKVVFSP